MTSLSELLSTNTPPVAVRRTGIVRWRLLNTTLEAIQQELSDPQLRRAASVNLLTNAVGAEYVAWVSLNSDGGADLDTAHESYSMSTAGRDVIAASMQKALATDRPVTSAFEEGRHLIALRTDAAKPQGLAVIVPAAADPEAVGAAMMLIRLRLLDEVTPPNKNAADEVPRPEENASTVAVALELTVRLAETYDSQAAAKMLCDLLRRHLKAEHVAIGLVRRSGTVVEPTALSDISELDPKSATAVLLAECLTETLPQAPFIAWSRAKDDKPLGLGNWQALADTWKAAELTGAQFADRKGNAAAVCLIAATTPIDEEGERFLSLVSRIAGPMFEMLERADYGRKLHDLRRRVPTWFQGRRAWGWAAAVALPLLFPWCARTTCSVVLEPISHRLVAAPFEGVFDRSLVMPGDRVEAGQVLGQMDGRELRGRLAACEADLSRAGKSRDVNLAAGKLAGSQIDRLEMERLEHERDLLRRRLEQLEIRSPIAGIVVTGDLRRYEGATLKVGHQLYEIAPLDRLTAELAVPEEDLEQVAENSEAVIRLDAVPGSSLEGRIVRIRPRGELRDNKQVFVAEVDLGNATEKLRPGMKGSSTVVGPRAPGVWLLLRKPFYSAVRFLGW